MDHIDCYLQQRTDQINCALEKLFATPGHPRIIYKAMGYSVLAGGKRLRPVLTLAAAESMGLTVDKVINLACAVELVHTYSLIHDDLPAMDNAGLRRGKPTCHKVFGEAVAILAGDALLTLAFELIADYGLTANRCRQALQITHNLAKASGVEGMIGGQVLDLLAEGKRISLDELDRMHRCKTGALIEAAVITGALAGAPSPEQLQALTAYASRLGLAFQIIDDILDCEGSVKKTGKQPHTDEAHLKSTYPGLLGLEPSRQRAYALYEEALSSLEPLGESGKLLRDLARYFVFRDK